MHHRSRLILAALAATAVLALAVSDASAGRFSTSERNFEVIWDNALSNKTDLEIIDSTAGINIRCRATLLGHFNESTIIKSSSINQYTITHGAIVNACEGGSATLRTETLPWNGRFRDYIGTLPRITSIFLSFIGMRIHLRELRGTECEATSEANHPAIHIVERGLETTGEAEDIIADRNGRIPIRGSFLCDFAGEGELGGIGLIRNLPRTGKIRLTLI